MANALYELGRQKFLEGSINYLTDSIKVALVRSALYTANMATDEFFSVIPGPAVTAISNPFASKTSTGGVADAADITFSSVSGSSSDLLVIFKDTGATSTSPLLALIDTATSGLPIVPSGGDIVLEWSSGLSKIFKI